MCWVIISGLFSITLQQYLVNIYLIWYKGWWHVVTCVHHNFHFFSVYSEAIWQPQARLLIKPEGSVWSCWFYRDLQGERVGINFPWGYGRAKILVLEVGTFLMAWKIIRITWFFEKAHHVKPMRPIGKGYSFPLVCVPRRVSLNLPILLRQIAPSSCH